MKLFIAGRSPRSDLAVENLHRMLAGNPEDDFELTVIDVLEDPQLAEDDFVLATPTLIKVAPTPSRRIIGDLSDRTSLLRGLDIRDKALPGDPKTT